MTRATVTPAGKCRNRSKKEGGRGIRHIKTRLTIATFPAQMHETTNIYAGTIFDPSAQVAAPGRARHAFLRQVGFLQ